MDLVAMVQERYFSEALKFHFANGPRDQHLLLAEALNLDPNALLAVAAGEATLELADKDRVAGRLGYSLQEFFYLGQDLRSGAAPEYAPRAPLSDEPCGCGEDHAHGHHHHHEGCGCGHGHSGGIGDLRGCHEECGCGDDVDMTNAEDCGCVEPEE